ncbi:MULTISPECIES: hypothetical protein [Bacillota]|jgi:hypothetical protein|uniref:Sensor histidine kinase NatK C-terminal domain-containing protein n=2 Tax=Amedibacillus TaxID=2749846 RepID=A0A7G9GPW9_9FIRM|nr:MULTISPECIES: hypothetical protein [Bacillota]QNM12851.1 hypothetical protein H9Q80_02540 [[Eubacterium] hominis]MCH4286731.1 hypothetical protein [Amedibacillus hominis]RGB58188.1 hypothetical protein DW271_00405 [Absiella sp. AM22-9]RGB59961.1 hypothetical protein DW120_10030 [Absiella sp. AM10-20]RGB66002.1 hypothetical protein DW113_10350 [Absiella sp. AM09-45]
MSEYLFSVIDYCYVLLFFHLLTNKKIEKVKFIIAVVIFSSIQYVSEFVELPRMYASLKDNFLLMFFLIAYSKKIDFKNIVNAFIIDTLFFFTLSFCITMADLLNIDLRLSLEPGIFRLIFTLILKVIMFLLMWFEVMQIKKTEVLVERKSFMIIIICLGVGTFISSRILQLSEENDKFLFLMILYETIFFVILCFVLYYRIILKKKYDMTIFKELIAMTEKNIDQIEIQQREIQKLIHDTKNQLLEIEMMIDQNEIEKIKPYIRQWQVNYYSSYRTPICLNVYINNILQSKIDEFSDITFHLTINVPEIINMNTTDLIAFLTILINRSCNLLRKNKKSDYYLEIRYFDNELEIYEHFPICMVKEPKYINKFQDDYLKSIIEKYNGDLDVSENEEYKQCILLLF